jgi:putative membrane protein
MRRYLFLGTSMLAGMILLAGCNQNQNTSANGANPAASDLAPASQPDAETAQNAAPGGSVPAAPGQLSTATQTFLQDVALEDMYQVQAGQIAAMRSQSPDIKQYAQQMVDMRTQNLNMLKQLIGNRAPDYKPPTQLDQLHQALLDDLQAANEQQFDPRYIAQEIDQHTETMTLMRGYIKSGDDPRFKGFAQQDLQIISLNLQAINAIDRAHHGHVVAQANNAGPRAR